MTSRDSRPLERQLRAEAVAVDAFSSAFLACWLIFGLDVARSVAWAVVAALVGIALVQAIRLVAPTPDAFTVNLLGIDPSADRKGTWIPDAANDDGEDEESNLFGKTLAAIAIPFVALFVAIRIAVLYVVPTLVVVGAAATTDDVSLLAAAAAWIASVGISLANEFAVVRPIARRYSVPLD